MPALGVLAVARSGEVSAALQALWGGLVRGDEGVVAEQCLQLMARYSPGIAPPASVEEMALRRSILEEVDGALRRCLLASGARGGFWKTLLVPSTCNGLNHGNILSNGKWLRMAGSNVPDENLETLEPAELAALNLEGQAKVLGRFVVANDGVRRVDYCAVARVLDPVLLPAWTDWVLSSHIQSPGALAEDEVIANQERTLQDLLALWERRELDIAATPLALTAHYERPYRTPSSTLPVASKVCGELLASLYWNMVPADCNALDLYPEFEALRDTETLVFCPNWREVHVVHRCMSRLLEPIRQREGTRLFMLHDAGATTLGQCAEDWKGQALELELRGEAHFLHKIGVAAEELRSCNVDLMYFPELCPRNATSWMSMQRVARVQATGYGFPLTSGSKHMDYFLGGADVEGDGSSYVEQLVLIPGWGQAVEDPPLPVRARQRDEVDERVELVTVATSQKLNGTLLKAWEEILQDEKHASLQIFPSLTNVDTELLALRMSGYFQRGDVQLNGWTPRESLMDTLIQSDFYLDTYPYGGYNCLIEALACSLPIVTIEGDQARNRSAAVLLRKLGLPEFLIARDYAGYIAAAKRLIRDPVLRRDLRAQLADRELVLTTLQDPDAPAHFSAALEWMRQQGPRDGRKPGPPVLIRAGEAPHVLNVRSVV